MVVLLAGVGSVVAEVVAARSSSAVVVRVGLVVATVGFAVLLVAPAFGVFVAGLAAYGLALGLVDASSNMQAVTVEHLYRRPILPSFHAFWTAGGILGTLVTLATSGVDARPGAAAAARLPRRGPRRALRPPRPAGRDRRHGRRAVAAHRAPRRRDGPLLHGRHGRDDVGTGLPRRHARRPDRASPPSPRSPTSSRRSWPAPSATVSSTAHGAVWLLRISGVVAAAGARRHRLRPDVGRRRRRLHDPRRRRRDHRAAQLLGGRAPSPAARTPTAPASASTRPTRSSPASTSSTTSVRCSAPC